MDYQELPEEIYIKIFSLLPPDDILNLTLVCKIFNKIISNSLKILKMFEISLNLENIHDFEFTTQKSDHSYFEDELKTRKYSKFIITGDVDCKCLRKIFKRYRTSIRSIKFDKFKASTANLVKVLKSCENLKKISFKKSEISDIDDFLENSDHNRLLKVSSESDQCKDQEIWSPTAFLDQKNYENPPNFSKISNFSEEDNFETCDLNFHPSNAINMTKSSNSTSSSTTFVHKLPKHSIETLILIHSDLRILKIFKNSSIKNLYIRDSKICDWNVLNQITNFKNLTIYRPDSSNFISTFNDLKILNVKKLRLINLQFCGNSMPFDVENLNIEELILEYVGNCADFLIQLMQKSSTKLKLLRSIGIAYDGITCWIVRQNKHKVETMESNFKLQLDKSVAVSVSSKIGLDVLNH